MPYNIDRFNKVPEKRSLKYRQNKCNGILQALRHQIFSLPGTASSDADQLSKANDFDEMIEQLKSKFSLSTSSRSEQVRILTILPNSWTATKIQKEFNSTLYMAKQAKELVKEKGILSTPNARLGQGLSDTVKQLVLMFFDNDDYSRAMPGINDYVSEFVNGKRVRVQKRLLMMSLKECFLSFKETHPGITIGFSSFASLRPKHCQLLNSNGLHNVCVCTSHDNVTLLLLPLKKHNIDLQFCFSRLLCEQNIRTESCYYM